MEEYIHPKAGRRRNCLSERYNWLGLNRYMPSDFREKDLAGAYLIKSAKTASRYMRGRK